jgi:polyisoprenoid-binding protein YceI
MTLEARMMKKFSPVVWMASLMLLASTASAQSASLSVDGRRSTLSFISDAPGERIVGTASGISGSIQTDLANPAATTGTIQFPVSSMETGNAMRDRHMQGEQWLNGDANPNIVFTIERIDNPTVSTNGNRTDITGTAVGTVTINGVAAPVQAQVAVALNSETRTARIQPTFSVSLAAHNIAGRDGAIGDTVGATIAIEGTVYAAWE